MACLIARLLQPDLFFWGICLKSLVYAAPVENLDDLRNRLIAGRNSIIKEPGLFVRLRQCLRRDRMLVRATLHVLFNKSMFLLSPCIFETKGFSKIIKRQNILSIVQVIVP